MNPTIQVTPDTGALVAGVNITKITGGSMVAGALVGAIVLKKHHPIVGLVAGLIGGFFAGRKLDEYFAAPPTTGA
jgi:hypothetical protein